MALAPRAVLTRNYQHSSGQPELLNWHYRGTTTAKKNHLLQGHLFEKHVQSLRRKQVLNLKLDGKIDERSVGRFPRPESPRAVQRRKQARVNGLHGNLAWSSHHYSRRVTLGKQLEAKKAEGGGGVIGGGSVTRGSVKYSMGSGRHRYDGSYIFHMSNPPATAAVTTATAAVTAGGAAAITAAAAAANISTTAAATTAGTISVAAAVPYLESNAHVSLHGVVVDDLHNLRIRAERHELLIALHIRYHRKKLLWGVWNNPPLSVCPVVGLRDHPTVNRHRPKQGVPRAGETRNENEIRRLFFYKSRRHKMENFVETCSCKPSVNS